MKTVFFSKTLKTN